MHFEIESSGLSDLTISIRAVRDYQGDLRDALQKAGEASAEYMRRNVPFETGAMQRAIYTTTPRYVPGGQGGGGHYEVEIGIDRTEAPHTDWVLHGTGIFKQGAQEPQDRIYPANGNVMTFEKLGEGTVFTRSTTGQRPQHAWYDEAQNLAREIIREEIHRLGQRRANR